MGNSHSSLTEAISYEPFLFAFPPHHWWEESQELQPPPCSTVYVVCVCVVWGPAAGSSCVLRGQYTYWQSVIVPEGGVGGRHNAGWDLTRLLGSQMLWASRVREQRAPLHNTTDRCENLWLKSWPLCLDFRHQFKEDHHRHYSPEAFPCFAILHRIWNVNVERI